MEQQASPFSRHAPIAALRAPEFQERFDFVMGNQPSIRNEIPEPSEQELHIGVDPWIALKLAHRVPLSRYPHLTRPSPTTPRLTTPNPTRSEEHASGLP